MSKHVLRENCGKLCFSYILSSQRGITPSQIDAKWWHSNKIFSSIVNAYRRQGPKNDGRTEIQTDAEWRHLNLICNTLKQNMCKISAYFKACKRKVRKTAHFLYSKFTKRHISFKNCAKWQHSNLLCSTLKQSWAKFHLNNVTVSMQEKTAENCVFPLFLVPKEA